MSSANSRGLQVMALQRSFTQNNVKRWPKNRSLWCTYSDGIGRRGADTNAHILLTFRKIAFC